MLVHICCSVDSFYYLAKLKETYPHDSFIGFFDNPNIHPYSEYVLRKVDAKRSCDYFGIPFFEGEYDVAKWLDMVKGYENEPEKGARCMLCFDDRLEATCKKALEFGEKRVTTTLLMSPQKDHHQLKMIAKSLKERYDVEFVYDDFRVNGGTQAQRVMSKELKAYHQDYCGCIYGLEKQRHKKGRMVDEMFSPLTKQILPGSIEERLELYEKRFLLEREGKTYTIRKERFLNYRLLRGYVMWAGDVQESYILPYSTLSRERIKGVLAIESPEVAILEKEDLLFLSLEMFREISGGEWKTVQEITKAPLSFDQEISLREKLGKRGHNLGGVVVVNILPIGVSIDVYIQSHLYESVREILVT